MNLRVHGACVSAAPACELGGHYGDQATKQDVAKDYLCHDTVFCLWSDGGDIAEAQGRYGDGRVVEKSVKAPFQAVGEIEGFESNAIVKEGETDGCDETPEEPKEEGAATIAQNEPGQIDQPESPMATPNSEFFKVVLVHCEASEPLVASAVFDVNSSIETPTRIFDACHICHIELGTFKVNAAKVRISQVGFDELCITEVGLTKVRAVEVGSRKNRPTQIRFAQVCATQQSLSEICVEHFGFFQGCFSQIGSSEVGSFHVSLGQVCSFQICWAFKVCVLKIGSLKICAVEICPFQVAFAKVHAFKVCSVKFRADTRVSFSPCVPFIDSRSQNFQMSMIKHGLTLLCCLAVLLSFVSCRLMRRQGKRIFELLGGV